MTATYMHIGIPITEKKPNMTYNEAMKFWVSNVDDYDYKVEYLKFEEGTPFPEELHRRWHVAYAVDDLDRYADDADRIICGPMDAGPGVRLAFVEKDGADRDRYEYKTTRRGPLRVDARGGLCGARASLCRGLAYSVSCGLLQVRAVFAIPDQL